MHELNAGGQRRKREPDLTECCERRRGWPDWIGIMGCRYRRNSKYTKPRVMKVRTSPSATSITHSILGRTLAFQYAKKLSPFRHLFLGSYTIWS